MLGSSMTNKRVYQRRAETCGEVHPLDFTAAQGARGPVEREITDADFVEIIEARTDFVAQHLSGLIVRRNFDRAQKITSVGNRERLELGRR